MKKSMLLSLLLILVVMACSRTEPETPGQNFTSVPTSTSTITLAPTLTATATLTPDPTETHTPTMTSTPDAATILSGMGRIAFSSDRAGQFDIYSILGNGEELDRLTENAGNNRQAKWSPDGEKILFSSDRNGTWDVYLMDANGANQELVVGTSANETSPVWSKTGDQIAYISEQDGQYSIVISSLAGEIEKENKYGEQIYEVCCLAWGDGEVFLYFSYRFGDGWPLYLAFWYLTEDEITPEEPGQEACCLGWQPGESLGFAYSIGVPGGWQIFKSNFIADPKPIVTEAGNNLDPTWSSWHPRGQWIAYTSDKNLNTDIFLVEVNSGEITPLVVDPAEDVEPDWQPQWKSSR